LAAFLRSAACNRGYGHFERSGKRDGNSAAPIWVETEDAMRTTTIVAAMLTATIAHAGQTGAFGVTTAATWACETEQSIARVMAQRTAAEMRRVALQAGDCVLVEKGSSLWVHGGNALIEWGGVQPYDLPLYYPAAAASHE
jgi:hypothetical protein